MQGPLHFFEAHQQIPHLPTIYVLLLIAQFCMDLGTQMLAICEEVD